MTRSSRPSRAGKRLLPPSLPPAPCLHHTLIVFFSTSSLHSDLIKDRETRFRNLRLLLGEIPACHKPLLCKLTAMCHRLLQGAYVSIIPLSFPLFLPLFPPARSLSPPSPSSYLEPSNGLTPRYLAECVAHGIIRTPYLPQALSARVELARLLQNEEEIVVAQVIGKCSLPRFLFSITSSSAATSLSFPPSLPPFLSLRP